MRTLRLSTAVIAMLVLLGGQSGATATQDEEAPAPDVPHQVSGTSAYADSYAVVPSTKAEDRFLVRGYGSYDTVKMDDARLSGKFWHVWNRDYIWGSQEFVVEGEVLTGTAELVNDDGTWVGTMRGYKAYEPVGKRHYWQVELAGTGAYEGLSALLYFRGTSEYRHEVDGFVFPGPLPEYPDPVEVPE